MFCTTLNYVSLRLLGEKIDGGQGAMTKARTWILHHGTITHIPSWGKFWLCVLGVYDWRGNNPLPPEIWLLPYCLPLHPGRMWCHTRMVYLPMSYLYGKRFVGPISSVVLSLRRELYRTVYDQVNWDLARNQCAKVLNMLCCWVEDPKSPVNKLHLSRIKDYLWIAEDGMKMQGYNGSQLWDAVFGVQAISATNLVDEYGSMLWKAHNFIKNSQVRKNSSSGNIESWYRHLSRGGWPFSTPDNGWPVSDCTAEALKTVVMLAQMPNHIVGEAIAPECLYDDVHLLLTLQNGNGGFSSYELMRSYTWLEVINPAETFGDIIIDYRYVECTSAAVQGLRSFTKLYPNHRMAEIEACIDKAIYIIH